MKTHLICKKKKTFYIYIIIIFLKININDQKPHNWEPLLCEKKNPPRHARLGHCGCSNQNYRQNNPDKDLVSLLLATQAGESSSKLVCSLFELYTFAC